MSAFMSIREFAKLCREAEKAYKKGDMAKIKAANVKLAAIGYELIEKDRKVYIRNKSHAQTETP